jgi:CHASE3 domain sensor protein
VSRYGLIRLVLLTAILAIAVAVWGVGRIQASADDSSTHAISAGQRMLIAMLDQETGLRGYINTHDIRFLEPYRLGRMHLETAIAEEQQSKGDPADKQRIGAQVDAARQWQRLGEQEVAAVLAGKRTRVADALRRKAVMDRFRAANTIFLDEKQEDRKHDRRVASIVSIAAILVLGTGFATLSWLLFERPARRDARRRRRLVSFGDALQVARTEREAFDVLKRHLEGWLHRARAVVLIRNASQNRLEAATNLDEAPKLAEKLESAAPESCLAVRLAKPHKRQPGDGGLLLCDVCGELPSCSSCVPTIVGGEVVGSVIVQTETALGDGSERGPADQRDAGRPRDREPAQPRDRRATRVDGRAHRSCQPPGGVRHAHPHGRPGQPREVADGGGHVRPRSLQARERHPRPRQG